MDTILWQLLLQAFLIFLNAIFACAEIAMISMNDQKITQMSAAGNKRARKLEKLVSQPSGFLATIQVTITLSGFLGSAFAAENFADPLVDWILSLGVKVPAAVLNPIAVVVITLILSYLTLVLGELVPKRLAMKKTESLALGLAGTVYGLSRFFAPVVWILTKSTNLVLRLCGVDPTVEDDDVSKETILMTMDAGSEKGVITDEEKTIVQNLFEFDDRSAAEFATHRTDLVVLWTEESDEEWEKTIRSSWYSRYPICSETADNVVGILNVKSYFRLEDRSRENVMREAVNPAYFVPETVRADVLFRQMKQNRRHFAVVLDEYGGTSGIITMNDLLEHLVGDLEDDAAAAAAEPQEIEEIGEGTWRIAGTASLYDVAQQLEITLPSDEYETFGGLVFGAYGCVPEDGETFVLDVMSLHVEVTEIRDHRLESAVVTVLEEESADEEKEEAKE